MKRIGRRRPVLAVAASIVVFGVALPGASQSIAERTEAEILYALDAGGLPRAAWGGLLQETRPEIRRTAARMLASRPDPTLLFAVRRLAEDTVPMVRAEALLAAGRFGPDAASSVVANLAHGDPAVRQAAAWAACHIGGDLEKTVLRRMLVERDVSVQETLLGQAWRLPGKAWVARVAGFAQHEEPRLRRAAAASLARAPDGSGHRALRVLAGDEFAVIAATAVSGFASVDLDSIDRAVLLKALSDDRPRVQVAACQAWGRNAAEPDPASAGAIVRLFDHERSHVRAAALRAAVIHESVADADAVAALASPSSWTGRLAMEALAVRGGGASMVRNALASEDSIQARAGARAAARLGGKLLDSALSDPRAAVRLAALEVLRPDPEAPWLDRVTAILTADPDPMARARAVALIVGCGVIESADELMDLAGAWEGEDLVDARAAALTAVFDLTKASEPRRRALNTALDDPQRRVGDLVSARARAEGMTAWFARREPRRDRSWYLELTQWRKQERQLTIETRHGTVRVRLDTDVAPITSRAVWELARDGFYDGLTFHRVVPNFVVQGGDPRGDGWGGVDITLPDEVSLRPFDTRRAGIATSGANTGSCQFFFMLTPADRLAGHYTNFGEVVSGQSVLERLEVGDRILSVSVDVVEVSAAPQ